MEVKGLKEAISVLKGDRGYVTRAKFGPLTRGGKRVVSVSVRSAAALVVASGGGRVLGTVDVRQSQAGPGGQTHASIYVNCDHFDCHQVTEFATINPDEGKDSRYV